MKLEKRKNEPEAFDFDDSFDYETGFNLNDVYDQEEYLETIIPISADD